MTNELFHFPSPAHLAQEAANHWLAELAAEGSDRSKHVAISGGRIAKNFFQAITQQAIKKPQLLENVHFFWADERCVPPEHPESNFRLAYENMLQPLAIPLSHIHRIPGEKEPSFAAAQAAAEMNQVVGVASPSLPILDYAILGMGEDGHIASLFPYAPKEVAESHSAYCAIVAAKPPPNRITLTYKMLQLSKKVYVLASGPGKEEAFERSLQPEGETPLARLLKNRERTLIFTDIRREGC